MCAKQIILNYYDPFRGNHEGTVIASIVETRDVMVRRNDVK